MKNQLSFEPVPRIIETEARAGGVAIAAVWSQSATEQALWRFFVSGSTIRVQSVAIMTRRSMRQPWVCCSLLAPDQVTITESDVKRLRGLAGAALARCLTVVNDFVSASEMAVIQ